MSDNEAGLVPLRKPYYLENFQEILRYITKTEDEYKLFDSDDKKIFFKFNNLSYDGQVLYVRLLTRKRRWILISTLSIHNVNIDVAIQELLDNDFLDKSYQGCEENRTNLEPLLKLLNLVQIRNLYKQTFSSNPKETKKEDIIKKILIFCSKPSHFTKKDSLKEALIKKCQKVLGNFIMLSKYPMDTFLSLLLLYSLPMSIYEKLEERKSILYQMLLVKLGQISYPFYAIQTSSNSMLFPTKENFMNFKAFLDDYLLILENYERKKYMECIIKYKKTLEELTNIYKKFSIGGETMDIIISKKSDDNKVQDSEVRKNIQPLYDEVIIKDMLKAIDDLMDLKQEKDRINGLRPFLRKYSAYGIFLKIESIITECYQKTKNYKHAAIVLRHLIGQKNFVAHRRGYWYLRLALITENYLKNPKQALAITKEALEDDYVRTGFRLAIYERYLSLCPKCNTRPEIMVDLETDTIKKIYITGKLLPKQDAMGKSVFISRHQSSVSSNLSLNEEFISDESSLASTDSISTKTNSVSLCSVENLALDHYLKHGYTHGIHGEGSIFNTLTILYFWEEIFAPNIPDTFRNMFQSCPLDWEYDHFYKARRKNIDSKLEKLTSPGTLLNARANDAGGDTEALVASVQSTNVHLFKQSKSDEDLDRDESCEDCEGGRGGSSGDVLTTTLLESISAKWDDLYGVSSRSSEKSPKIAPVLFPGLNWDIFGLENGKELALGLLKATGPYAFGKIAERLIKDHRHTRGGFPDLTMWNVNNNTIKIVEVKGPNDRLSHKQILWLNYLADIGVDCEVCHVTTTHFKRPKH